MDWNKLISDLREANLAASEAADRVIDTGSANMDAVFLRIPRQREAKVLSVIREAGLYCRGKIKWIGNGYMITPKSGGQANKRSVAVTVMTKYLEERGWDVMDYRRLD